MDFLNTPSPLRAEFFKDVDGQRDKVEIKIVGDPNSIIKKVTPEVVAQFPQEWEAYQKRQVHHPEPEVDGTSLLEVPGVDRNAAASLKMHGVRTAEELAALDEAQARALGLGGLTFWKAAKNLIKLHRLEKMEALLNAAPTAKAEPVETEPSEPIKRKPGRPPKTEEAA
jgi:hypothetical protein